MPTRSWRKFAACSLPLLALLLLPGQLAAQDSVSSYDARALRIESSFWGRRLVQGSRAEKVGGLGMFPGRIQILEQSADSVRSYYSSYRSGKKRGSWLLIGGIALIGASAVAGFNEASGVLLLVGGVGFGMAGITSTQDAENNLHRAVWWYNRDLR